MGRASKDHVRKARADVARVISRSMRALKLGIGNPTPEEARAAFSLPQKEAPMWTHAALRLGSAHITVQGQQATPQDRSQLAVVVVTPAASVEAWQQQAEAFKVATSPKKLIEAVVSPSPVPSSKDS